MSHNGKQRGPLQGDIKTDLETLLGTNKAVLLLFSSQDRIADYLVLWASLYEDWGATYTEHGRKWKFPNGATLRLGAVDATRPDFTKYRGARYSVIETDGYVRMDNETWKHLIKLATK